MSKQLQQIDVEKFIHEGGEHPYIDDLNQIPADDQQRMILAGIDVSEEERSGTYIQEDHSVVHCKTRQDGLEVLDINTALERYEWLRDYMWRAVNPDTDEFTRMANHISHYGYFIRALPGARSLYPVQACLYLKTENLSQNVHNIVIADEGSELHIITGCSTSKDLSAGLHIGISEFYVKKGAKLSFTMIHNWSEGVVVRPRSITVVEEDAQFINNFIILNPVKSLQMYPTTYMEGPRGVVRYNSILVTPPGSHVDAGGRVYLRKEGCRAEIISRTITTGGHIIARGHLIGEVPGIRAHLECKGLILGDGVIHAIPELEGRSEGLEMSHEAAVGRIAQEEIEYLMARGLSEEEATSVIVRGFLNVDIQGLPPQLQKEIDKAIQKGEKEFF
nr:SufD family Fe-S cluster assembly protein [Desulfobacterales bacterium]